LESEYKTYAHERVHEAMKRNTRWLEKYKIGGWPRWDYDLESSILTFSEKGRARVTADMTIVGTVSGSTWEWSWGNPHMPVKSQTKMERVRLFGEEKKWDKLTTLFLPNDDYLGWEFTAITAHILGAEGGYRCPEDGGFLYLVLTNTRYSA
jgi:hypothetical protein